MKNPFFKKENKSYEIFLILIFPIFMALLFYTQKAVVVTGFLLILMFLVSLKEWNRRNLLLILSPILTYPLYLFLILMKVNGGDYLGFHWLQWLYVFILIYAVIYTILLRNVWEQIAKGRRKKLFFALIAFAIFTYAYMHMGITCFYHPESQDGKGYEANWTLINFCRSLNIYVPEYINGKFAGLPNAYHKISMLGPSLTALFVSLKYLVSGVNSKK